MPIRLRDLKKKLKFTDYIIIRHNNKSYTYAFIDLFYGSLYKVWLNRLVILKRTPKDNVFIVEA